MEPIAIIARRNLRSVPEFKALQMPKTSARGQAFIASADGMTAAATVHKDALVAHGLPSTFLDNLKKGIARLQTFYTDREKSRTQRVGATKGLTVEEKNGRTVLSVLDALVKQSLGSSNDALLRKWESVRHIRRTTANTSTNPAPTPVTPAAGTSTPAPATTPAAVVTHEPTPAPATAPTPATA